MIIRILFHIIFASLLVIIQQIASVHISHYLLFIDVIVLYLVLHFFFSDRKHIQWMFIVMFFWGIFMSVWSGRPLGFDSFLFTVISFMLYPLKDIVSTNIALFIVFILGVFLLKFVMYILLGIMFNFETFKVFALSLNFLKIFIVTLISGIFIYLILRISIKTEIK